MQLFYEHFNNHFPVWEPRKTTENVFIEVTEISFCRGQQAEVQTCQLLVQEIKPWLARSTQDTQIRSMPESLATFQAVWIKFDHTKHLYGIDLATLQLLLKEFHLETADGWNATNFMTITKFPPVDSLQGQIFSYSLCNHPKVAVAWSCWPSTSQVRSIIFAPPDEIFQLQGVLASMKEVAMHPMFLAVVFGMMLSGAVEQAHKGVKDTVRRVEVRTNHHSWASRTELPASGSFESLTKQMTGAKTRLANLCRRTAILREVCHFVRENLDDTSYDTLTASKESLVPSDIIEVEHYIQVLERRTRLQQVDVEFFKQRVEAQIFTVSMNLF